MPAIHSINLEFVVSTRHTKCIFNKRDLEHLVPHYKTHSISVYFDNDSIGYVSRTDTPFVFDCLKNLKSKRYLIAEWNIVCHKPYYIVINCSLTCNSTWKVWIYQLIFKNDNYIGSTICLPSRINTHKKQLKHGYHHNKKMIEAYKNCNNKIYDIRILDSKVVSSNSEKLQLEQQWIDKIKPTLNLCKAYDKKDKIKCECGSVMTNLRNHIKTNKHIKFICQYLLNEIVDTCVDRIQQKNSQNVTITCQE